MKPPNSSVCGPSVAVLDRETDDDARPTVFDALDLLRRADASFDQRIANVVAIDFAARIDGEIGVEDVEVSGLRLECDFDRR